MKFLELSHFNSKIIHIAMERNDINLIKIDSSAISNLLSISYKICFEIKRISMYNVLFVGVFPAAFRRFNPI